MYYVFLCYICERLLLIYYYLNILRYEKQKDFFAVLVLALVTTVFQLNRRTSYKFNCLMENVEALADNDQSGSRYRICYNRSRVKTGYTYYDCGTCQKVYDEKGKDSESKFFY